MAHLSIEIPEDLAERLEKIAREQDKTVRQVAVERLRTAVNAPGSPAAIVRALRERSRPTSESMDEFEAAIQSGKLPIREQGEFDEPPTR